jgi:hypothetical protein
LEFFRDEGGMPRNPAYPLVDGRAFSEIRSMSLCDNPDRASVQTLFSLLIQERTLRLEQQ